MNDCLLDITKRYNDVVNQTGAKWPDGPTNRQNENSTTDLLSNKFSQTPSLTSSTQAASTLDELSEIFSSHSAPTPTAFDVTDVLKPISVHSSVPTQSGKDPIFIFIFIAEITVCFQISCVALNYLSRNHFN